MASLTDKFTRVSDSNTGRPIIAQLAGSGKGIGATSVTLNAATNWTLATKIHAAIYNTVQISGKTIKDTSSQTEWEGTLSGTTISNLTLTGGVDQTYLAGAYIELTPTAKYAKDLYDGLAVLHNPDGTFKAGAVSTTATLADSIVTSAKIADGAVTATKLLSTIFSGQVSTYTNTGTGAGTFNYVNVGGLKVVWGSFNSTSATANNSIQFVLNFPSTFFTVVPTVIPSNNLPVSNGNWIIYTTVISTSATGINASNNSTVTASTGPAVIVIGV